MKHENVIDADTFRRINTTLWISYLSDRRPFVESGQETSCSRPKVLPTLAIFAYS